MKFQILVVLLVCLAIISCKQVDKKGFLKKFEENQTKFEEKENISENHQQKQEFQEEIQEEEHHQQGQQGYKQGHHQGYPGRGNGYHHQQVQEGEHPKFSEYHQQFQGQFNNRNGCQGKKLWQKIMQNQIEGIEESEELVAMKKEWLQNKMQKVQYHQPNLNKFDYQQWKKQNQDNQKLWNDLQSVIEEFKSQKEEQFQEGEHSYWRKNPENFGKFQEMKQKIHQIIAQEMQQFIENNQENIEVIEEKNAI